MVWFLVSAFTALTLLAALRLLAVWRRSRELPELLIAVLILGVGTTAVGLGFLMRPFVSPALATLIPLLGASVGMAALALFNWRVYRPHSRVAGCTFGALAVGLVVVTLDAMDPSRPLTEVSFLALARSAIYVGVMAWSAAEALAFWMPMRRRQRLGLADPVVTNRVLLWGIATGVSALGILIGAVAQFAGGVDPRQTGWVAVVYAVHGSAGAVAFWLAFAPPRAYARWIRSRVASS